MVGGDCATMVFARDGERHARYISPLSVHVHLAQATVSPNPGPWIRFSLHALIRLDNRV